MSSKTPWGAADWTATATLSATASAPDATVHTVFKQREIHPTMDPKKFNVRESRNSPASPKSTPIGLFGDVTGSMGITAHLIAQTGFATIIGGIFDRMPVTDPQIMFGGIGDIEDHAPLQASQFEVDKRILEQLLNLWVEGNGGGNGSEAYNLPWHFFLTKTSCDAFEKDGRKGFLFSWGDEMPPPDLTAGQLESVYGPDNYAMAGTNKEMLTALESKYHVFHILLAGVGNCTSMYAAQAHEEVWRGLMGQKLLVLDDYTKLGELIVSTMQVVNGDNAATVAASWGDSATASLSRGLATVSTAVAPAAAAGGLVRL